MKTIKFLNAFGLFFALLIGSSVLAQTNEFEIPTMMSAQDTVLKIASKLPVVLDPVGLHIENSNNISDATLISLKALDGADENFHMWSAKNGDDIVSNLNGYGSAFFNSMIIGGFLPPIDTLEIYVKGDAGITISGDGNGNAGLNINNFGGTHSVYDEELTNDMVLKTANNLRLKDDNNIDRFVLKETTGRIGVNIEEPLAQMHIKSTGGETLTLQSDGLPTLNFYKSGSAIGSNLAWMQLQTDKFRFSNNVPGSDFDFSVRDESNFIQTALTIKDDAKVGIGTIDPLAQLGVYSESDEVLRITSLNNPELRLYQEGSSSSTKSAKIQLDTGNFNLSNNVAGGRIDFKTNSIFSTTKMSITSTGNVGIGTTSPDALLDLTRSAGTGNLLSIDFQNPVSAGQDLIELKVASGNLGQFIEMENGNNIVAKVDTDGDATFKSVTFGNGTTQKTGIIAYGVINADGTIVNGSGNFSCSYNAVFKRYEISITGENYIYQNYVTQVTPISSNRIADTGSVNNELLVNLVTSDNVPESGIFSFLVLKI